MTNTSENQEFSYELKIPQERIAVLIGTNGETKKEIESTMHVNLEITPEGEVAITGHDAVTLFTAREIVRSIGRGFNPKIALQLAKSDYALEIIDISDLAGKNKNMMEPLKGRVIGKGGKSREEIERLTETHISIYGKTIGIIGEISQVSIARQAVAMLVEGSMHKTVYHFLEKKKKEMMFGG